MGWSNAVGLGPERFFQDAQPPSEVIDLSRFRDDDLVQFLEQPLLVGQFGFEHDEALFHVGTHEASLALLTSVCNPSALVVSVPLG